MPSLHHSTQHIFSVLHCDVNNVLGVQERVGVNDHVDLKVHQFILNQPLEVLYAVRGGLGLLLTLLPFALRSEVLQSAEYGLSRKGRKTRRQGVQITNWDLLNVAVVNELDTALGTRSAVDTATVQGSVFGIFSHTKIVLLRIWKRVQNHPIELLR